MSWYAITTTRTAPPGRPGRRHGRCRAAGGAPRRIRGPHLRRGAPPAALHRPCRLPGRPGGAVRVVVMAYQDIGYVCLDELLALGAEVALVVTHPDPATENIWFRSVAERARQASLPVLLPPSVNAPDVVAEIAR